MEEGCEGEKWDGYVDWRGRPALKKKHGGMVAASFVLVVEVMENMAFISNASNLVTYLDNFMHFSPARSATTVTNFMGTAFLLALPAGFLSDAFFNTYVIYIVSATIEFLGLLILTIEARSPGQKAPNSGILFLGLYLTALGVGGIKGSLPSHGADQLDQTTPNGRLQRSTFFNYFVFSLSTGALIAVTFVVWIQDNKGWLYGFSISTLTILLSIPTFLSASPLYRTKIPSSSPLTLISKHLFSSLFTLYKPHFTPKQTHQIKSVLKIIPIFLLTIMLNCCLAQLSTFSVQQASTMDTKISSLTIPPASLPLFPVLFIMTLAPLYHLLIIPFSRKLTRTESGISHLQRIGIGLLLSILAMAVAALVETKRKRVALNSALIDSTEPLPISFFWIALQYLFLGSADLFTLAGLLEFFFTEAPAEMRSVATSLSWVSLAMGYYFSSALVSVVNSATRRGGREPWLAGRNLNYYHLDRFYWLMCGLSAVNFAHYLFWAMRYKYKSKEEGFSEETQPA